MSKSAQLCSHFAALATGGEPRPNAWHVFTRYQTEPWVYLWSELTGEAASETVADIVSTGHGMQATSYHFPTITNTPDLAAHILLVLAQLNGGE